MKCSLGISNSLEEISSLFRSVVFLYFFALIAEEDFLISPCFWNSAFRCLYLSFSPLALWNLIKLLRFFSVTFFIVVINLCLYIESESEVVQSCPTFCDPMDIRLLRPWDFQGKSTGVGCLFLLQGTFWPRDWTQVSRIVDRHFTIWATRGSLNIA